MNEGLIFLLIFLSYGIIRYRKWLNKYRKEWVEQLKYVWNQGK